jgi:4-hydroxy-3-methylbut-2-enyl diphosphate reductase IspH
MTTCIAAERAYKVIVTGDFDHPEFDAIKSRLVKFGKVKNFYGSIGSATLNAVATFFILTEADENELNAALLRVPGVKTVTMEDQNATKRD